MIVYENIVVQYSIVVPSSYRRGAGGIAYFLDSYIDCIATLEVKRQAGLHCTVYRLDISQYGRPFHCHGESLLSVKLNSQ